MGEKENEESRKQGKNPEAEICHAGRSIRSRPIMLPRPNLSVRNSVIRSPALESFGTFWRVLEIKFIFNRPAYAGL
jgi:hypothetical protein